MRPGISGRLPRVAVALVVAAAMSATPLVTHAARAAGTGPVAEWTFDEGSGSAAHDSVGANHGTLSGGATWVTGGTPQGTGALQFDGVDGLVTIPDAPELHPAGTFTVAAWVKAPAPAAFTSGPILAKGDLGCNLGASWEIDYTYMGLEARSVLATWGWSLSSSLAGPGYNWFGGDWHLVTYTVDPTSQTSTFTLDGHVGSRTWPGPDSVRYDGPSLASSDLHFGGRGAACLGQLPYHGALDDIRIWDRALSESEILGLLGPIPTTTDVNISLAAGGSETSTAHPDQQLLFAVKVSPWPASPGDVTWYRSKNGGPEEVFATTPLRISDMTGFAFVDQMPGTLGLGAYTIRASWPGSGDWLASTSPAMPLTITPPGVTMQGSAQPDNVVPGGAATLTARLAPQGSSTSSAIVGQVDFYETTGGANDLLASVPLVYLGNPNWNEASVQLSSVPGGTHTYEARWAGSDAFAAAVAPIEVVAGLQVSAVSVDFTPNPALDTQTATAHIHLSTWSKASNPLPLPSPTGTLVLMDQPSGDVVQTVTVTGKGEYDVQLPELAVGTRQFVAGYSGDASFDPATSPVATLAVAADVVEASGVGVQYPTVYPYRDGYRDTDAIRGNRLEVASVAIRVYSPQNRLVKTFSIAPGIGPYAATWTGRNSGGTVLPAGTYKVVQVVTDAAGTRLTIASSIARSPKRLYTYTTSYTKNATTQPARKTSTWFAWSFTLPSATLYRRIVVWAYGKSNGVPLGGFGPHDFTTCSARTWFWSCTARRGSLPLSYRWRSVAASVTADRSGRTVRTYAWGGGGGSWIARMRVTVTYAILR